MNLKVTLNWAYIKNEIDYETYKAAEITITNDPVVKGEAQSDNTNADADFCRAKIDTAVATLEEIMHRHYLTTSLEAADNVLQRNKASWVINLFYSDSERRNINLESLTAKCHRFVVDYVLWEWCKLALPSLIEGYKIRMADEEEAICQLINRKVAPTLFAEEDDSSIDLTVEGLTATANAVTLDAGAAARAEVTVTKTTSEGGSVVPSLNFTLYIPQGQRGQQGQQGIQGEQGQQGVKGDDGTVDYDAAYAQFAQTVETKVNGLNQATKDSLAASIAAVNSTQAAFIQSINAKAAEQDRQVAKAIEEAGDVKEFVEYTKNQPKYSTLENMILSLINSKKGEFGTNVSWGAVSAAGGSVVLDVAGTQKSLLLNKELQLGDNWFFKIKIADEVPATYYAEGDTIPDGKKVGDVKTEKVEAKYAIGTEFDLFSKRGLSCYEYGGSSQSSGASYFKDLLDIQTLAFGADDSGKTVVWNGTAWVKGTAGGNNGKIYTGSTYIEVDNTANTISLKGVDVSKIKDYTVSSGTAADGSDKISLYQFGEEVLRFGTFAQKSGLSLSDIPDLSSTYALKDHTHSEYLTNSDISGMLTTSNYGNTLNSVYLGINANAASASKLATARTLWGQSFNGSADVSGSMSSVGNITMSGALNLTASNQINYQGSYDSLAFNYDSNKVNKHLDIFNGNGSFIARFKSNGNVGIGITDPQYKLDVNGAVRIGNGIIKWDSTNNALYVECPNGASCGFYSTGGLACYSGLGDGTGSVSSLANLTLSNQLTASKAKLSSAELSGILSVQGYTIFGDYVDDDDDSESLVINATNGYRINLQGCLSINGGTRITGLDVVSNTKLRITYKIGDTTYIRYTTLTTS